MNSRIKKSLKVIITKEKFCKHLNLLERDFKTAIKIRKKQNLGPALCIATACNTGAP